MVRLFTLIATSVGSIDIGSSPSGQYQSAWPSTPLSSDPTSLLNHLYIKGGEMSNLPASQLAHLHAGALSI